MRIVGYYGRAGRDLSGVGDGRCKGYALQRHLVDRCDLVGLEFVPLNGWRCGISAAVVRVEPDSGRLNVTVRLVCCIALES